MAEQASRKHKGSVLNTIIFEVTEIDIWKCIGGDLDDLEVTR